MSIPSHLSHGRLLRRSPDTLTMRVGTVLTLLPTRNDMAKLICRYPVLLDIAPTELQERAEAIRTSYRPVTINTWDVIRLGKMLRTPSEQLRRLQYVENLSPALRIVLPDLKVVKMKANSFHRRFVATRRSNWKRRPGTAGGPTPRQPSLLEDTSIPPTGGGLLQFGADQARAAAGDQGRQVERRQTGGILQHPGRRALPLQRPP